MHPGETQEIQAIACQQILYADSSVFSVQWTDIAKCTLENITIEQVLSSYLEDVRRLTGGIISVKTQAGSICFELKGIRAQLLCFEGPHFFTDGGESTARLLIKGGLLVQPGQCRRGQLEFSLTPIDERLTRLSLRLSDYCPLLLGGPSPPVWRKWFYQMTQSFIHRLVTISFIKRFYRKVGGRNACTVSIHSGKLQSARVD